jgi:hypothetical protein
MHPVAFVVGAICAGLACKSPSALSPSQSGAAGTGTTPSEAGAPADGDGDACSADASEGTADTAGAELIGPQGGSISQHGATLVIPAGALLCDRALGIVDTGGPPRRDSEAFGFIPDVAFATPVTITIPMYEAHPNAHLYWSAPPTGGLIDLGGVVSGLSITAQVSRLGGYAFACDPSCGILPGATGADAGTGATD